MTFRLLLVFFFLLCGPSWACAQVQRPNVLLMIADTLRYESCGYAGDEQAVTPNIDRLAATGISFDNYVVNTPLSAAMQATLWTGKYASTHGLVVNGLRLNPNHDTLGHLLTAKGYTCDYIGRWDVWGNCTADHELANHTFCPPGAYRFGFDGFWAAHDFRLGGDNTYYFQGIADRHRIEGWGPACFTDLAIDRVTFHAQTQQPFAMVVAYSAPHAPWTANHVPDSWYDRFQNVASARPSIDNNLTDKDRTLRVQYAMTAAVDEQVGRLLQAIDDQQLAGNTIVMFTSAPGERCLTAAHTAGSAEFPADTTTFRDTSLRVPLLIRWPGKIPPRRRSNACISAVDVMPTVCGMLGVGFPDATDGIDLSDSTRVDCSCEPDFAFLQGMGHPVDWSDGFEWRAIRDQRFTYAQSLVDRTESLYDNRHDPQHATNLVGKPDSVDDLNRLRQWLIEKRLATHDDFRTASWYRSHWTKNQVILRGANGPFHRDMGHDVEIDSCTTGLPQVTE